MRRISLFSSLSGWALLVIIATALTLAGCSGGSSIIAPVVPTGNPNPFTALGRAAYVGRVVYRLQFVLTANQLAALTAQDRAALAASGATITGNTINLPDTPATGHWVQIGTLRANTDDQGRFVFPSAPGGTTGGVYKQLTDNSATVNFSVAQFVVPATNSTIPEIVINRSGALPDGMNVIHHRAVAVNGNPTASLPGVTFGKDAHATFNPGDLSAQASGVTPPDTCCAPAKGGKATRVFGKGDAHASGSVPTRQDSKDGSVDAGEEESQSSTGDCTARNVKNCAGNAGPCCLDFNNPSGDGKAYLRSLIDCPRSYTNFLYSTCYQWTWGPLGTACNNEGAYPWNVGGPGCYQNHKYRNCQNLNPADFSITPDRQKMFAKETLTLAVSNNTPGNETAVDISANPGKLTGTNFDGTMIKHYDDTAHKHMEKIDLTYTAPDMDAFPAGQDQFSVTVTIRSYSKTQTVTFTVCKCPTPTATTGGK